MPVEVPFIPEKNVGEEWIIQKPVFVHVSAQVRKRTMRQQASFEVIVMLLRLLLMLTVLLLFQAVVVVCFILL